MIQIRRPVGLETSPTHRPQPRPMSQDVRRLAPADAITLSVPATRSEDQLLEAGIQRLDKLATELEARGDRRALFPRVYLLQLRGFQEDVKKPGQYQDPAYMTKMVRLFLDRYFLAFDAHAAGDAKTPEPWRKAFAEAANGPAKPATDLMLAMTAHIAHDLPLALVDAKSTAAQKADYTKFNEVLKTNIDGVQELLEKAAPGGKGTVAGLADTLLGPVDEFVAGKLMVSWRETAWKDAQALQSGDPKAYGKILSRANQRVKFTGLATAVASWSR